MSNPQRLVGTYLLGFEPILVSVVDGEVLIRFEGVPEELAAGPVGSDNSYVVVGSQMGGATVDFDEGDPAAGGRVGGIIDFVRADDTTTSTSGRGLRLEELEWEAGEEDLYRQLADGILQTRDGRTLELRNGAMSWPDRSGNPVDLYRFTVHKDFVGGDIWRTGTLYLFSRADFEPIPFYPGGPASNEWASTSELGPLARLAIDPADFPFLNEVGGHDDGELIAAEEIGDIVMAKIDSARSMPDTILVSLTWDDDIASIWDDLETRRRFSPDVENTLTLELEGRATIEVRGPEGFLQAYEASLVQSGIHLAR